MGEILGPLGGGQEYLTATVERRMSPVSPKFCREFWDGVARMILTL